MEELHLYPSLLADLGQTSLAALQGPLAGHNAGILVRIGVAYHHLLQQPARTSGPKRMVRKTGPGHREFQEGSQHFRTTLQVFNRFQQGHHRQQTDHALGIQTQQPGLAGQNIDAQQVRKPTGHAHDQGPQSIHAVDLELFGQNPISTQDRIGLWARRSRRMQERAR